MDDKGSTLLAVFGLPPLAHENDATRAVLSSLLICEKLFDLGLLASVVSYTHYHAVKMTDSAGGV